MENAVEALKIAFAVMIFAMALTLSISSFSNASRAIDSIISMEDRETEYTYVEASANLTRTVGIETVVSSAYESYKSNTIIYFYYYYTDEAKREIPLYYDVDLNGERKKDSAGKDIKISYIDLSTGFANEQEAIEFLDVLFGGTINSTTEIKNKYEDRIYNKMGLYNMFSGYRFEERIGEYYQGTGSTKIKKKVITYIVRPY